MMCETLLGLVCERQALSEARGIQIPLKNGACDGTGCAPPCR